ncbi:AMP-binding protein [Rhizohabitans arisaemae]|uniref:AMP-binding protein n=1 Tax=Rhizohabitans arisaemae TaxID=2720610 RepID=UPI0024B06C6C|nr:AMP-binding protein [Rhizohabitans arisaemae]
MRYAEFEWSIPDRFNMAAATCGRRGDDLALLYLPAAGEPRRYTFADMDTLSSRFANALEALGVARGDRVAVLLPQRPEVPVAHLAAWKLGAVSLPLTTLFGPEALRHRLGEASPRALVCEAGELDRVREACDGLDLAVVAVDAPAVLPAGCHGFEELLAAAAPTRRVADTAADDPAFLLFTSGTTGPAKGALHAHRMLLGHLPGVELPHNLFPQPGDLMWTPADWAWIGGLMDVLFPAWYHGVGVVAAQGRFDPERAWRFCAEYGVRNTFLPPTALRMMREVYRPELARGLALRSVGSGGEQLGEDVLAWGKEALGVTISEFYGQTEVNLVVGNCPALFDPVPGSMGRAIPGHRVAILRPDGSIADPGERGEIAVALPDPVAFLGYWNKPEATAEKTRDGWVHTGDEGYVDENGFFFYTSRSDDVINSAGYRIGPGEIEQCLATHPAVLLTAVVGEPDPVRGEAVVAYVELREGVHPGPELAAELQQYVKSRLAAYLYPRRIEFVGALPRTTTGKIMRSALRRKN